MVIGQDDEDHGKPVPSAIGRIAGFWMQNVKHGLLLVTGYVTSTLASLSFALASVLTIIASWHPVTIESILSASWAMPFSIALWILGFALTGITIVTQRVTKH